MKKKLIEYFCKKYIDVKYLNTVLYKKKILISGSSGFLGGWLLNVMIFLNNTYNLKLRVCLILRSDKKKSNLIFKDKYGIIENIYHDLTRSIIISEKFNYFFHFAAETFFKSSKEEKKSSTLMLKVTKNIEKILKENRVEKLIFLSSGAVYGKDTNIASGFEENDINKANRISAINYYGKAKIKSEKVFINSFSKDRNLDGLLIIRAFAFGGSGFKRGSKYAFDNFIKNRVSGKNINLNSTGHSIRSYLHPIDFVIWLISNLKIKGLWLSNIGSEKKIRLINLAKLIANIEIAGLPKVKINIGTDNYFDNYIPNLSLAKKKGFKERISLNKQIKEAIISRLENKPYSQDEN